MYITVVGHCRDRIFVMYRQILISLVAIVVSIECLRSDDILYNVTTSIPSGSKLWAILVAGSNTWMNYRHQADVCHAYQVLHNHGIPDEQIVVMMTDDLAHNILNPTPGIIINHLKGPNVYKGVPRDYTKEDVTPKNFLNILQGERNFMNKIGSGKVIESGPNDHIFFYFADHGAPGLLAFPDIGEESQVLYARQLLKTLKRMHKQKKYNKMVIYVEACESGSMFENLLPNNISIYATTAANPDESSYACYYDDQLETYLGDVYSVKWLEDSDKEILKKETLQKQFQIVKKETTTSHVQEYGDLTIGKMKVSEFQGRKDSSSIIYPSIPLLAVPSMDVPLHLLKYKLRKSVDIKQKSLLHKQLMKLLRNRQFVQNNMKKIVENVSQNQTQYLLNHRHHLNDFDCYENAVQHFHEECFHLNKNEYVLQQLYVLVNLCEEKIPLKTIKQAMENICIHPPIYGII